MNKWKPSLTDTFGLLSDRMQSYFERTKRLVGRPDEKGAPREDVILEFLKEFLPNNLGIEKGYVINLNGDCCDECDIIIFRRSSPIFKISPTKNIYIIPIEDVFGVIEVKSVLTEYQYKNCQNKKDSFFHVHKNRHVEESHLIHLEPPHTPTFPSYKPFFAVFCYEVNGEDFYDNDFYHYICDNPFCYLFCLNEGVYSYVSDAVIARHHSLRLGITIETSSRNNNSLNEITNRFCMSSNYDHYNSFKFDDAKNGDMLMIMFAYLMDKLESQNLDFYSVADYIALWRRTAGTINN
jgi:hypothetical protein